MAYTAPQIGVILLKADRTMYKIGQIAYDNMFAEDNEALDYERDIIFIYKKAVEYADDLFIGTEKLDKVVERLAAKIAAYDYGALNPVYADAANVSYSIVVTGASLNDLTDVTITNLQDNQNLRYNSALGQWINVGPGSAVRNSQSFIATAGQTTFTTSFPFDIGLFDLYLNGVKLNNLSYTTVGEYQIVLNDPCSVSDIVDVVIFDPFTSILPPINSLDDLTDVAIGPLVNNQVLYYNSITGLWQNGIINNGVWGSITGTLSNQTDLQDALDAKQNLLTNPVTGTGVNGRVGYWSGTNTQTSSSTFLWDNTLQNLTIGSHTYTPSASSRNLTLGGSGLNAINFVLNNQLIAGLSCNTLLGSLTLGSANLTDLLFYVNNTFAAGIFADTRNVLIQDGGTFTDNGARLQVTGTATIASSGSGATATITHTSGSGIGLNITKGGSGEGLYINKTSGSGNAATIIGTLNATSLVKSGGTATQYLMADGSVSTLTNPITGTGAAGQVAYFTGATTQAGSNNLFWDNTNKNLTISGDNYNVGTYWNAISASNLPSGPWRGIAYGNGLFVAVSSRGGAANSTTQSIATSPDGVNWTFRTIPSTTSLINITYQNGIFVAVGQLNQRSFYSYDGINWFNGVNFVGQGYGITYGRDKFVACKIDNPLFRINISYDGINWQSVSTPATMDLPFVSVTYGNDIYVAVAESTSSASIAISYDGLTWNSVTRPSGGTITTYSVCYGKGLFIVPCTSGKIMTSPDGVNWTVRDTPLTGLIWKCIYAEGLFIAAGSFASGENRFIYSVDGITWKEANTPALNNWSGFAYGNGMLIAITFNGTDSSSLVVKSGELNSFITQNDNITHGKQIYTDDVVLNQTNRLGIGTSAPVGRLVVASGNTLLGQNTDSGQRLQVTGTTLLNGNVTFSSATGMFWDATNSRLGIGTNAPQAPLHINATSSLLTREQIFRGSVSDDADSSFIITNGSSANNLFAPAFGGYCNSPSIYSLGFTGFTTAANDTADSAINLGLVNFLAARTTTPLDPYNGTLSAPTNRRLFTFGNISNNGILTIFATTNVAINSTTDSGQRLQVQGTSLLNGNVTFSSATGMTWDATNSRLGIGTNTPQQKLDVLSTDIAEIKIKTSTNTGAAILRAYNDLNNTASFGIYGSTRTATGTLSSGDGYMFANNDIAIASNGNVKFGNTTNERMRIWGSTGNVLIQNGGTFSDSGERLQVTGAAKIIGNINMSGEGPDGDGANRTITGGRAAQLANIVLFNASTGKIHLNSWNGSGVAINGPLSVSGGITFTGSLILSPGQSLVGAGSSFVTPYDGGTGNFIVRAASSSEAFSRFRVQTGTTPTDRLIVYGNGNVIIQSGGTFTDSGEKLQVTGTAKITGLTTFNAGISLSNFTNIDSGNNQIRFESFRMKFATAGNTLTTQYGYDFASGVACTLSSGYSGRFTLSSWFAPTSGTAEYVTLYINPIINQTGGANGVTRGLFVNPTLTSAADFRAIEVSAGISVLAPSTTASATLRIPSGTAPTTPSNGDIWFDGTDLKMRIGGVTKTFTLV